MHRWWYCINYNSTHLGMDSCIRNSYNSPWVADNESQPSLAIVTRGPYENYCY